MAQEITLTVEKLEQLLKESFKAGESWGVTYYTWFTPTEQDHKEKFAEFLTELKAKNQLQ